MTVPEKYFDYPNWSQPPGGHHRRFDEAREECPVFRSTYQDGHWVFTRMAQLREIYADTATFSNSGLLALFPGPEPEARMIPMMLDPPEHGAWRRSLMSEYSSSRAKAMAPLIRSRCTELIERLRAKGSCDAVAEFTAPLPTLVFLGTLGLPDTELDRFLGWQNGLLHPDVTEEDYQAKQIALEAEIVGYLAELVEKRAAQPGDDLISRAFAWDVDGRAPTGDEIVNVLYTLFAAGQDTVTSVLSFSLWHMATHPADRRRVTANPDLLPSAVEELLRYYSIILDGRRVTRDAEVAGCPMRKGDAVLLLAPAANRDPAEFDRADEVVLDRSPNRHVAFGMGTHRCVGAHLARQQLRIALEEWHRLIPEYHVPDDAVVTGRAFFQVGLRTLPLRWKE
ncbi:cytochrome P450 [Allokutzneria sp. A3M-2-11 16]|uniref:cytochrome P450 n=1 Tax=Allokutzneria sp. A3M-2-11 16 TaxID=2962043 RepID=UPI0020B77776|nr:cytochrome P450 [Allokutzneria sp. A3M-2-11 16]MCP3805029.1 cytochrome P450 [Allokutzneria sp. A3M-2-11 16]